MKRKGLKSCVLILFLFSTAIVALAFAPHHTCACGQYEDSSQLTHLVNSISEKLTGKPVIEKNPKPFF